MQVTSQEANKILNNIREEVNIIEREQEANRRFVAATIENKEDLRPDYNFMETQNKLFELELKELQIRHALNVFNATTEIEVGQMEMTLDKALVFIPWLEHKKFTLQNMKGIPEKVRKSVTGNIIDYVYRNYDMKELEEEYANTVDVLNKVKQELNKINVTKTFVIPD